MNGSLAQSDEPLLRLRRRERARNETGVRSGRGREADSRKFQDGRGVSGRSGIPAWRHHRALLDEAMGKVCRFRDVRAVTAELTIEYLKPIPVEQTIVDRGVRNGCEGTKSLSRGGNSQRRRRVAGARARKICDRSGKRRDARHPGYSADARNKTGEEHGIHERQALASESRTGRNAQGWRDYGRHERRAGQDRRRRGRLRGDGARARSGGHPQGRRSGAYGRRRESSAKLWERCRFR